MTYRCARVRGRWCGAHVSVSGERLCLRGVPEVYLIAARKDHRLGLVIPEQLSSGVVEIQSAADYPLHLPAGWAQARKICS